MPKITAVSKPRWSVRATKEQQKRKATKKSKVSFEDVLHMYMLKLISECQ